MQRKKLAVINFGHLPRRIAEDAVEAPMVEDLGEGEMPVEEAVLTSEGFDFGLEVGGEGLALDEVAEVGGGDAGGGSLFLVLCSWLFLAGSFGFWSWRGLAEKVVVGVEEVAFDRRWEIGDGRWG